MNYLDGYNSKVDPTQRWKKFKIYIDHRFAVKNEKAQSNFVNRAALPGF